MAAKGWSLRDLYRTLETAGTNRLRDAQAALDSAVRAAYGMKDTEDTLAFMLRLNLELAETKAEGEPITPPGLPRLHSMATPKGTRGRVAEFRIIALPPPPSAPLRPEIMVAGGWLGFEGPTNQLRGVAGGGGGGGGMASLRP